MQKDKQERGIAKDLGGRPPALKPEHVALLRTIVLETPHATLGELAAELQRRGAVRVCEATIRRSLRAQGIVRLIPKRESFQAPASGEPGSRRYGYTAAHRPGAPQCPTAATSLMPNGRWLPIFLSDPPVRAARLHATNAGNWSMRAAMCCAPVAPGDCCHRTLRLGRQFTKPLCAGPKPMLLSRCMTGCASSGASEWGALHSPALR